MTVVKMLLHNKYKYIEPIAEQLFFKKKKWNSSGTKIIIHSLNKFIHLLSTYYMPGAVLGLGIELLTK